jgi:hypothetical protein
MQKARLLTFAEHGDHRGRLVALEGMKDLPFSVARLYYMYGMAAETVRGKHANRSSANVFIAVKGQCSILVDNGNEREVFKLESPGIGLLCEPMTWKEMYEFSADCVLAGLSDRRYDAGEYIGDYETFRSEASGRK